jgi:cation diffusion facilitator CzcD-associated flavoprotein CzcO
MFTNSIIGDINTASPAGHEFPIVIVGTGFSGIAMGVLLKKAGIHSFTILEKGADVGGTWRENTYPGAACDVPSHLYCYSFEPNPDWSRSFSPQPEIQSYLRHCVEKYGLGPHIRFEQKVDGAEFDTARGTWTVRLASGETLEARALVLGNGALHIPSQPDIPGLEQFQGARFHSAQWDHDYDLGGKRVAVIGTGASAIQIVPEIAKQVSKLEVFQRTPPWIAPKADRRMRDVEKRLFRRVRPLHWLYRAWTYWALEMMAVGFVVNPRLMRLFERFAKRYIAQSIPDPALRKKVTPSYTMGCKRVLLSNDWYPTLCRPNVDLVTDGIERVTARGIVTRDGVEHEVDAIVSATGFMVSDYLSHLHVVGRHGRSLNDTMQAHDGTYLGITAHGFPNLFMLMGPNTGLGHNSMIFMIEAQARYAVQAIQTLRRRRLRSIDVLATAQRAFTDRIQAKMQRSVWASGGCRSWYMTADGYNGTLWPYFTFQYWWETRRLSLADYEVVPERVTEREPVVAPAPVTAAAQG